MNFTEDRKTKTEDRRNRTEKVNETLKSKETENRIKK